MSDRQLDQLLAEQLSYYRRRAPTYLEDALTESAADRVKAGLAAAFDLHCRGEVLELACGPGTWTGMLARCAASVTAVDGAPEMLELAAAATPAAHVRFAQADIFGWRPDRRYDAVFFGFWLSHVPQGRFAPFWELVGDCLRPAGRVLFVDDGYRTADELLYGTDSEVIQRKLRDGSRHRIVKTPHTAAGLQRRLVRLGWEFEMHDIPPFFWGVGQRSPSQ